MTAVLFDGLASLAIGVFSEDVLYVSNDTTLAAKVRVDFVEVDDGETYKEVTFLHFAEDDLSALSVVLSVDDVLTVRGANHKILDVSATGRGLIQARLGAVI